MSIHWPIVRAILRNPRRIAVVDDRGSYTAAQILGGALHLAAIIEQRCATRTVGVLLPTGGLFPMAMLGAWFAGKTLVPLNYLLKHEELQYVIDDCETDTVLTVGQMLDFMKFRPRVKELALIEPSMFEGVPDLRWPSAAADDDLAMLLYTSGTSGRPKGVMLTHGNISANVDQLRDSVEFSMQDVLLGVLPQFHTFGLTVLTILPLAGGLKVVYTARFVPNKIIKLMREHRPSIFIGIASMWGALLSVKDATPEDFASMRLAISGGEPLPDAIAQRVRERFGVTINEGFGMTETSPVTNLCQPHHYRPHSVGPALARVEQRIIDLGDGRSVGPGVDGEIQFRGPNIMKGYYKQPEQTAAAFSEDGWLRSGDIGHIDQDGHLYITGRLKEMMIIGGENVFPREIEEAINRHPAVAASGVISRKDPVRGEVPVAFVELREGQAFDRASILEMCRKSLAGYKIPSEIYPLEALPKNPTGKVMRRDLKQFLPPQG